MEIVSAVKCECPNQVSKLLTSMGQFEDYERRCASANEPDRVVHERLYELTVQARTLLEEALALVLEHDQISL